LQRTAWLYVRKQIYRPLKLYTIDNSSYLRYNKKDDYRVKFFLIKYTFSVDAALSLRLFAIISKKGISQT
jgi:hypothetical protein